MAHAKRKPKSQVVPRKRMLKEAPKRKGSSAEIGIGRESTSVLLVVLAVFLALALYSYLVPPDAEESLAGFRLHSSDNIMGRLGLLVAEGLILLLGWCSFITVVWALLLARTIWTKGWPAHSQSLGSFLLSVGASVMMAFACATMATVLMGYQGGGRIGSEISYALVVYVNEAGALLLSAAVFLISVGLATGVGTAQLVDLVKGGIAGLLAIAADCWFLLQNVAKSSLRMLCALGVLSWRVLLFVSERTGSLVTLPVRMLAAGVKQSLDRSKRKEQIDAVAETAEEETASAVDDEQFVLGDLEQLEKTPEEEYTIQPIISRGITNEANKAVGSGKSTKKKLSRLRGSGKSSAKNNEKDKDNGRRAAKIKEFRLPLPELLVSSDTAVSVSPEDKDLIHNSKRLEQALRNFRIGGRVTEVHPGPVITLYQFEPAAGIKVQRIVNLADDLALALKVASVRVFAPVPGKGTVGIEVPNSQREMVRLREIVESEAFIDRQSPLSLAFGKNTYGEPYVASLPKMPHLLIAGATGTGKSVCINSLLISLLFKNTPDDLRLILIDPKMLELSVYEDIPHLMVPVITMPRRARGALWWAAQEMDRRYVLMKAAGVRDISMYNRMVGSGQVEKFSGKKKKEKFKTIELEERDVIATGSPHQGLDRGAEMRVKQLNLSSGEELERLPRIVIVVDELADLMFTVGREIEELLTRLAQKARAAGIHLILATQRPSVNVITGLIKANFPARISFKVASKIDARTVMDTSGAEKLLGQGDLLFMSPGTGGIKRLHSPYVSDKEVHDIVDCLRDQGVPQYDTEIEKMIHQLDENEASGAARDGEEDFDPLYDQAVNYVIEKGQASTSMVQRVFRIGYNRAARILECMEREGVVGPADGAKPRQVLVGGRGDGAIS